MSNVNLRILRQAGHRPNFEEVIALRLATAMHFAESDDCVVSWEAQERAETFFNEQGASAAISEILRCQALIPEKTDLCRDCLEYEKEYQPMIEVGGYMECKQCQGTREI